MRVGEEVVQGSLDFFFLYISLICFAYRTKVIIKLCVTIAVVEEGKHMVDREESKRVQNAVHTAEVWRRERERESQEGFQEEEEGKMDLRARAELRLGA